MSRFDLITFDMDGTLLDSSKRIRPDSLAAIHEAVLQGKTVALSTGRNPREIEVFGDDLVDVRYIISSSGALVYDFRTKEVILSSPIDESVVRQIFERTADIDSAPHLLADESVFQRDRLERIADYGMGPYQAVFRKICVITDNVFAFYDQKPFPIYKFNLYCRTVSDREEAYKRLAALPLTMVNTELTGLECSAYGISKGSGLKALCAHLGIPISQSIAVGDADNDLDILRTAGLAVAMGNANDNARAAADVIVADNDHGGCAEAIYQYLLK